MLAAGHGRFQDAHAGHLGHVLREVAHDELLGDHDRALVGALLVVDNAEDGGLARAVGADQAHAIARVDLEAAVLEEVALALELGHLVERDHRVESCFRE
ncbi:hypothetical protein D3C78_1523250 [compost metagenome]